MTRAFLLVLCLALGGCTSGAMVLAGIAIQAVFHVTDDAVEVFAIEKGAQPKLPAPAPAVKP